MARVTKVARLLVEVLGSAQDGGVPQPGCRCPSCMAARKDPRRERLPSALLISESSAGTRVMLDCPPTLPRQWPECGALDAILLTHAHMGHYTGLMYLGREAMALPGQPVVCTPSMATFLRDHLPWKDLVDSGYLILREIAPGVPFNLGPALWGEAIAVPHRNEHSDTVAFRISSGTRSVLYLPDLDGWEGFEEQFNKATEGVDLIFIDGTFWSREELGTALGRDFSEVSHPPVRETLALFAAGILDRRRGRILFTHLNHTHPALDPQSEAEALILAAGFGLARDGDCFVLEQD